MIMNKDARIVVGILAGAGVAIGIYQVVKSIISSADDDSPWETYYTSDNGEWQTAIEFDDGNLINTIYQGIDLDDSHYADPGSEYAVRFTDPSFDTYQIFNLSNISTGDHNYTLFTFDCGEDSFFQNAHSHLDDAGILEFIGYQCRNIYTGEGTWLHHNLTDDVRSFNFKSSAFEDPYYFCGVQLKRLSKGTVHQITGIKFKGCEKIIIRTANITYSLDDIVITNSEELIAEKVYENSNSSDVDVALELSGYTSTLYDEWDLSNDDGDLDTALAYKRNISIVSYDIGTATFSSADSTIALFGFNSNSTSTYSYSSQNETVTLTGCSNTTYQIIANVSTVEIRFSAYVTTNNGIASTYEGTLKKKIVVESSLDISIVDVSTSTSCSSSSTDSTETTTTDSTTSTSSDTTTTDSTSDSTTSTDSTSTSTTDSTTSTDTTTTTSDSSTTTASALILTQIDAVEEVIVKNQSQETQKQGSSWFYGMMIIVIGFAIGIWLKQAQKNKRSDDDYQQFKTGLLRL